MPASLFFHSHRECRKRHNRGVEECLRSINAYFGGEKEIGDVVKDVATLKAGSFLTDADVEDCCRQGIRQYASTVSPPICERHVRLLCDLLGNIGLASPSLPDPSGELEALGVRLYQGLLTRHFADGERMEEVERLIASLLRSVPVSDTKREEAALTVLDKAAGDFLADGMISDVEQKELDEFMQPLGMSMDSLPERFGQGNLTKIKQAAILRQLQKGEDPAPMNVSLPIMLGAKEYVVWVQEGVILYQEKKVRQWVGRSSGVSVRITKGVYYRVGASKGHPVEHTEWDRQGKGSLVLTNKNIIFFSPTKSAKIPYKKIITVIPYNDGVELHKDGVNAKTQIFQGFDSWFVVNFLSFISV